jgi:hypothetical protein
METEEGSYLFTRTLLKFISILFLIGLIFHLPAITNN